MSENKQLTTKDLFTQRSIQERFEKLLGKKSQGFISSVLQIVNSSDFMSKAEPTSVLNAAATAASLDLPINQSLGFAWIVPYKDKKSGKVLAQFQIGWKGYVQLGLRTGQYQRINVTEVYENQFKSFNRLTEELNADFSLEGEGEIVGYAAYFRLINGMEKLCYWSKDEVVKHAKKYSQAYSSSYSPWSDKDQFHAMAKKTVLKNTISKWGIMTIEMQTAQLADQAVIEREGQYRYIDNEVVTIEQANIEEETNRIKSFIDKCKTLDELNEIRKDLTQDQIDRLKEDFNNRENELILETETK